MLNVFSEEMNKLFMYVFVEYCSVHDSTPYDNDFRRDSESDIETELGKVIGEYFPYFLMI